MPESSRARSIETYNLIVSTRTLISVADFDRLLEPDELRYELDEGELIEMVRPRYDPHNRIVRAIGQTDRALLAILPESDSWQDKLAARDLFVLGPTTKRAPDLAFLTNERMQQIQAGKDIEGAPDLAIERSFTVRQSGGDAAQGQTIFLRAIESHLACVSADARSAGVGIGSGSGAYVGESGCARSSRRIAGFLGENQQYVLNLATQPPSSATPR